MNNLTVDMSTAQIMDLLTSLYSSLDDFGLECNLTDELISRSKRGSEAATAFLAYAFDSSNHKHIDWLADIVSQSKNEELPSSSAAYLFCFDAPVTGDEANQVWHKAIPESRRSIDLLGSAFFLPSGERIEAVKNPGGDGYYAIHQDGTCSLFFKRGNKALGDKGWMWVKIDPQKAEGARLEAAITAAIDPLCNYEAMGCMYTPLFERIAAAHGFARGWGDGGEKMYSPALRHQILGHF